MRLSKSITNWSRKAYVPTWNTLTMKPKKYWNSSLSRKTSTNNSSLAISVAEMLPNVSFELGFFKITGISSTDENLPMHLWCRLLRDANDTLNMLRPYCLNITLSPYNMLHSAFDFNRTSLSPRGCKFLLHENPNQLKRWETHGINGWYLNRAREWYRCYRVYFPSKQGERLIIKVEFFPQHTKIPLISSTVAATKAATNPIKVLNTEIPATPFPHIGSPKVLELKDIATVFNETAKTQKTFPRVIPTFVTCPLPAPKPESNPPSPSPRVN